MATLRDIRRRIDSVGNTMQITNAMKMVATAKLNRAQNAVRAAQPYAEVLRAMVTAISSGLSAEDHPLFEHREGGKSAVLLFTSDRGLCGAFNANLNKTLLAKLTGGPELSGGELPDPELMVFGRLGTEFFRRRGFTIGRAVVHATPAEKEHLIREIIGEVRERFVAGEVGRVSVAYNHYRSPISQEPRIVTLLPIEPPRDADAQAPDSQARPDNRETLFEPSLTQVLDRLLPDYLENQCLLAHLNTDAGEQGARMVAMDGATRNAGEMINSLTLQMNKARQAAITKELIEIVSGAEAL